MQTTHRLARRFRQRPTPRTLAAALTAASLLTAPLTLPAFAQLPISKTLVTLTDIPAPNTEDGTTIFFFQSPVLDAAGNVAYVTQLAGPSVDDSNALITYYGLPGNWQTLRVGTPDPADPSLILNSGARPIVSPGGLFVLSGSLTGPGVDEFNSEALYSGPLSSLARLSRSGQPTPGAEPQTNFYTYFQGSYRINDSGLVAFQAGLAGPDITFENNQSTYLATPATATTPATVQRLYRQNDLADGFGPTSRYFFAEAPLVSPTGQVAFSAQVATPSVEDPSAFPDLSFVIYSKDASADPSSPLRIVSRTGDLAPGYTDPTARINLAIQPRVNRSGTTYYTAYVTGQDVPFEDAFAVYADTPGQPQDRLLFRTGQPAPLTAPGVNLAGFADSALNTHNILTFGAELTGPGIIDTNNTALYTYSDNPASNNPADPASPWSLIAREGDLAPGTDLYFGSLTFGAPSINAAGQVAFYTGLIPDLNDPFTGVASLWLYDPTAGLTLIAKEGDLVEVAPGDTRLLASLTLDSFSLGTGLEDGRRSSFNDAGQLVYAAYFADDSSAILLATPATTVIPEPTSLALALPAAALTLRRRR